MNSSGESAAREQWMVDAALGAAGCLISVNANREKGRTACTADNTPNRWPHKENSMTKPEGPAQEPQGCPTCGSSVRNVRRNVCMGNANPWHISVPATPVPKCKNCEQPKSAHLVSGHIYCPISLGRACWYEPVDAATPAPSQPEGAREKNWLVEAVENCPDPVLKQNCKQLLGNDYTNAAVQFIADTQTAAKDVEIRELTLAKNTWSETAENYKMLLDTKERELKEAINLYSAGLNKCGHVERERDGLLKERSELLKERSEIREMVWKLLHHIKMN